MNIEMAKVYQDLMNEVIFKLKKEGDTEDIRDQVIYDIQNAWKRKLRSLSEASQEKMYEKQDFYGYSYSEEESHQNSYYEDPDRNQASDYSNQKNKGTESDLDRRKRDDEEEDASYESYSSGEEYEMIQEDNGNYLMCLYVKVHRTKNKWKCAFKLGFINLGDVDFAFLNAQGELEW